MWGEYIRPGFPIAIFRSFEAGGFKIVLLFASWLGNVELATYTIIAVCTSLTLQIALGICTAAHNLIHNALVSFHDKKAKKYTNISI